MLVWRTGGLEAGIAAHVVNNVFAYVIAGLTTSIATLKAVREISWVDAASMSAGSRCSRLWRYLAGLVRLLTAARPLNRVPQLGEGRRDAVWGDAEARSVKLLLVPRRRCDHSPAQCRDGV